MRNQALVTKLATPSVTPAKAGGQKLLKSLHFLDSRLRGNDACGG
jgi:hypothetical protein